MPDARFTHSLRFWYPFIPQTRFSCNVFFLGWCMSLAYATVKRAYWIRFGFMISVRLSSSIVNYRCMCCCRLNVPLSYFGFYGILNFVLSYMYSFFFFSFFFLFLFLAHSHTWYAIDFAAMILLRIAKRSGILFKCLRLTFSMTLSTWISFVYGRHWHNITLFLYADFFFLLSRCYPCLVCVCVYIHQIIVSFARLN